MGRAGGLDQGADLSANWLAVCSPLFPLGLLTQKSICGCPGGTVLWDSLFCGKWRAKGMRWVPFSDGCPSLSRKPGIGIPSLKCNSGGVWVV